MKQFRITQRGLRIEAFRRGLLDGLAAPSMLMTGKWESPLAIERRGLTHAWTSTGKYLDGAMTRFGQRSRG